MKIAKLLDAYFIDPYKQYPVMICGQRVILTNGELAEALSSLPEKKREIIYLYFFGHYTQQEIGEIYGRCRSTAWHHIHSALQMLREEMEVLLAEHVRQTLEDLLHSNLHITRYLA
jgi:predicted DNA-binding protein YlxM (UPF0122 family)